MRLRTEVLPLLEDVLQGGVAEALGRTAGLLRDDLAALDVWADQVINAPAGPAGGICERDDHGLDVAALADLPRAVRTRVLRRLGCGARRGAAVR